MAANSDSTSCLHVGNVTITTDLPTVSTTAVTLEPASSSETNSFQLDAARIEGNTKEQDLALAVMTPLSDTSLSDNDEEPSVPVPLSSSSPHANKPQSSSKNVMLNVLGLLKNAVDNASVNTSSLVIPQEVKRPVANASPTTTTTSKTASLVHAPSPLASSCIWQKKQPSSVTTNTLPSLSNATATTASTASTFGCPIGANWAPRYTPPARRNVGRGGGAVPSTMHRVGQKRNKQRRSTLFAVKSQFAYGFAHGVNQLTSLSPQFTDTSQDLEEDNYDDDEYDDDTDPRSHTAPIFTPNDDFVENIDDTEEYAQKRAQWSAQVDRVVYGEKELDAARAEDDDNDSHRDEYGQEENGGCGSTDDNVYDFDSDMDIVSPLLEDGTLAGFQQWVEILSTDDADFAWTVYGAIVDRISWLGFTNLVKPTSNLITNAAFEFLKLSHDRNANPDMGPQFHAIVNNTAAHYTLSAISNQPAVKHLVKTFGQDVMQCEDFLLPTSVDHDTFCKILTQQVKLAIQGSLRMATETHLRLTNAFASSEVGTVNASSSANQARLTKTRPPAARLVPAATSFSDDVFVRDDEEEEEDDDEEDDAFVSGDGSSEEEDSAQDAHAAELYLTDDEGQGDDLEEEEEEENEENDGPSFITDLYQQVGPGFIG